MSSAPLPYRKNCGSRAFFPEIRVFTAKLRSETSLAGFDRYKLHGQLWAGCDRRALCLVESCRQRVESYPFEPSVERIVQHFVELRANTLRLQWCKLGRDYLLPFSAGNPFKS